LCCVTQFSNWQLFLEWNISGKFPCQYWKKCVGCVVMIQKQSSNNQNEISISVAKESKIKMMLSDFCTKKENKICMSTISLKGTECYPTWLKSSNVIISARNISVTLKGGKNQIVLMKNQNQETLFYLLTYILFHISNSFINLSKSFTLLWLDCCIKVSILLSTCTRSFQEPLKMKVM